MAGPRLDEGRIVDLVRIGDRDELSAVIEGDEEWLVVADPVGDVLDAFVGEVIQRIPRLGKTGAEPADRLLPGKRADLGQHAMNRRALFSRLHLVEPARVGLVVAEDLPA